MTTFMEAVRETPVMARTENGAAAYASTLSKILDMFYNVSAYRKYDEARILAAFEAALQEDVDLGLRLMFWCRDIRGGAGERRLFRTCLKLVFMSRPDLVTRKFLDVAIEVGRFDDLFEAFDTPVEMLVIDYILAELTSNPKTQGLAAKWLPRQGAVAKKFYSRVKINEKSWRKLLVKLTNVVETDMCARAWEDINYSHVPSVAMKNYTKAFKRHTPEKWTAYLEALKAAKTNPEIKVKVNAGAVFPYQVCQMIREGKDSVLIDSMWDALKNYVLDVNVLPLIDCSGSMTSLIGGTNRTSCMDVALSLGLYFSSKNTGKFKDGFLTFSSKPKFEYLTGTLTQRMRQMEGDHWAGSTNIEGAFAELLRIATTNQLPAEEMPSVLLIVSDMQFNPVVGLGYGNTNNETLFDNLRGRYAQAGYKLPLVVFWNVADRLTGNAPTIKSTPSTVMVGGFSPAVFDGIAKLDIKELASLTPAKMVIDTLSKDRYKYN